MPTPSNAPGIRVIPPLVYLVGLLLAYALEWIWPIAAVAWQWRVGPGVVLIVLSFALVVPAMLKFKKAATPFDVRKPATALVTDGPNRYTRNPGYVALTLLYLGVAILMGSVWALALLVPVFIVMTYEVVRKEERHLEAEFGDAYLQYQAKVRRWL